MEYKNMKKIIIAIAILSVSIFAYAKPCYDSSNKYISKRDPDYKVARRIIYQYFLGSQNNDLDAMHKLLLNNFREVEAEKVYNFSKKLKSVKTMKMKSFKIKNFQVMRNNNLLVCIYQIDAKGEVIGEKTIFDRPFYRLTILKKCQGKWRIWLHANPAYRQ
jgi:hypothetical protein